MKSKKTKSWLLMSLLILEGGQAIASELALEEILVTARQQQESLQDVPVTVAALTGEDLQRYNVQDLEDAASMVPNLQIHQAGSGSGSALFLRGIGSSTLSAAFDQSLAINIDGVVGSNGRLIHNSYLDLAQMEVLKGPQSLYFGKSATAGVVSMTTNDPGDEFEFIVTAAYESEMEQTFAEMIVSGPLSDTFGARLALGWSDTDELLENTSRSASNTFRGEESINSRLTLLWEPTDELRARVKASYSEYENDGVGTSDRRCVDGTPQDSNSQFAGVFPAFDEDCKLSGKMNRSDINPVIFEGVSDGNGGVPYLDQELTLFSLELNYQLTEALDLTSISAYLEQDTNDVGQYCHCTPTEDGEPFAFYGSWSNNDYEGLSQEFRLTSDYDGAFNFMLGLFYQDVEKKFNTHQNAVNTGFVFGVDPATGIGSDWRKDHTTDTEVFSAFLALYWDITDNLELTVGARYTNEEREGTIDIVHMRPFLTNLGFLPAGTQIDGLDFDDSNTSPEVSLNWHYTDDISFYAAYKNGFKSGGIDNSVLPNSSLNPDNPDFPDFIIYDSEEASGFEIGMKSTLLDGQMRLNATAFSYIYEDLQVQQFDNALVQFSTFNVGEVTTQGVEADLLWQTNVVGLVIRSAWAWTDAEYTDDFVQLGGKNLDGFDLERSAEFAGFVGFTYDFLLGRDWQSSISVDARYTDDYVTAYPQGGPANAAFEQDGFWTYDAGITVTSPDEHWEVSLFGRNLDDEYYVYRERETPGAIPGPSGIADQTAWHNYGRTVTFRVKYFM